MVINALKYMSGGVFKVVIENEEVYYLEDITVHNLKLKKDLELTEELYDSICDRAGIEGARRQGLRLLGAGRKTGFEIKNKLKQKGFGEKHIEAAIDFFNENGLINDFEYAKCYACDAIKLKKYSKRQIKQKLMQKGIAYDIIEDVLAEKDDLESLKSAVASGIMSNVDTEKLKRRLYAKGFAVSDIMRVIREYEDER